jgi:excisionase family DNA binding protein
MPVAKRTADLPAGTPTASGTKVRAPLVGSRRRVVITQPASEGTLPEVPTDPPDQEDAGPVADGGVSGEQRLLHTPEQAAVLLQVPASWLRKKSAAGLIPCTRIGRHLRFSTADLDVLIHDGARPPSR